MVSPRPTVSTEPSQDVPDQPSSPLTDLSSQHEVTDVEESTQDQSSDRDPALFFDNDDHNGDFVKQEPEVEVAGGSPYETGTEGSDSPGKISQLGIDGDASVGNFHHS